VVVLSRGTGYKINYTNIKSKERHSFFPAAKSTFEDKHELREVDAGINHDNIELMVGTGKDVLPMK